MSDQMYAGGSVVWLLVMAIGGTSWFVRTSGWLPLIQRVKTSPASSDFTTRQLRFVTRQDLRGGGDLQVQLQQRGRLGVWWPVIDGTRRIAVTDEDLALDEATAQTALMQKYDEQLSRAAERRATALTAENRGKTAARNHLVSPPNPGWPAHPRSLDGHQNRPTRTDREGPEN